MSFKEVLSYRNGLVDSYEPSLKDPNIFLQESIIAMTIPEDQISFIVEVFNGVIRHSAAIKPLVDWYSSTICKKNTTQENGHLKVLSYMLLFRLDDLSLPQFRKIVICQKKNISRKFLEVVLEETLLKTVVFSEWCKHYEHSYAQVNLLAPLLRWLPELKAMLQALSSPSNKKQQSYKAKKPTELKPFNLTQLKPRSVPIPEQIPQLKPTREIPETTYQSPKELNVLSKTKTKNRQSAEKRLIEASNNQFSCANAEISEKTKEKLAQYVKDEEAKLKFDHPKARPLPRSPTKSAPIRLNAATILREGILAQKREEETEQKLTEYMVGGRDASEFINWQQAMKEKDLQDQLADIERRRLEGKLSYEEAIYSRKLLSQTKQNIVKEMKKESEELMQEYVKMKIEKDKEMKELIEQIVADHENAKEAKRQLQKYKRNIVQSVNEESRSLMQAALEKEEEDMKQKVSLISKIRAMESVPVIRFKRFDITESSGAGLLGEMSVAELRERLCLLKAADQEQQDKKRNDIQRQKSDKDRLLQNTLEAIAKDREERNSNLTNKSQSRSISNMSVVNNDEKITALQEKLERLRTDRRNDRENAKLSKNSTTKVKQR